MARPTKLTQQMLQNAFEAAELGMHNALIADYCGISEQTFYDWLRQAAVGTNDLAVQFSEQIRKGRVLNAKKHLRVIDEANDPQVSKWMLERRHGYKPEQTIEHTGNVTVEASPMERASAALAKLKGS